VWVSAGNVDPEVAGPVSAMQGRAGNAGDLAASKDRKTRFPAAIASDPTGPPERNNEFSCLEILAIVK
jgi:hypothetical protein